MPTPTPTPKVTPAPLETSPWLGGGAFIPTDKNKAPTSLLENTRAEVTESSRDEQFSLLPPQTSAVQGDVVFFQRRYTPTDRFAAFSQRAGDTQSGEIIRNMPQIFDALVYCPLSNEIVFQAPPISTSDGKFNLRARPTRVYLFSLTTGQTSLIWRREKDREGTFVPRMSATPDCRHVLLNLALEAPGNKTPYGELVYLRRPSEAKAGARNAPPAEWTSSTISETSKNGVWKGFGQALFVQPTSPDRYVPSEIPPRVFAITDMVEKDKNVPLVNVFTPSGGARVSQAAGIRWSREREKAERDVRDFTSPSGYDRDDAVFLVMESNETNASGANKRAIVAFRPRSLSQGMKRIVEGGELSFRSLDVHPSGTRLAVSYTAARTEAQVAALTDRAIAGLAEFTLKDGAKGAAQWSSVMTMLPFQGLETHHDPRPVYAASGKSLFFVNPAIADLPEPALFGPAPKVNKELQFGSKLMQIDVPGAK